MKVFSINPAMYSTNFNGKNNKHKTNPQYDKPQSQNISSHRLNNAIKAAVMIPLVAGSFAACDRTEVETSQVINPPNYSDSMYIHRFPEITVNGATFSEQSVYINKNLDPDSRVNRSLNNLLNTLDVPKKTEGAFPVNMFWSSGNHVYHMMMDGSLTDNSKFVYHFTDVNRKEGTADNYVLKFTDDGSGLNISSNGVYENSNYNFVNKGDSVLMYKNNENDSEKTALFKKKMVQQPNGKDKYTVEQTNFANDTTKVSNENFVVWSVNNEN